MRHLLFFLQVCILASCAARDLPAASDGAQPAGQPVQPDPGWPRQYTDGAAKLVLQQPQVDTWKDFRKLTARFAATLTTTKSAQPVWGVLSIESDTVVNLEMRTVGLLNFRVTGVSYPSAKDAAETKVWEALSIKLLPAYPTSLALDRVLAYMDKSMVNARQTAVLMEPPPILVSTQLAILVIIDGEPVRVDIENTNLQKVVNTNWDLFCDKKGTRYYLRDDKVWLSATGFTEAWTPVDELPKDFSRLPATEQYAEVRQNANPQKPTTIKLVLVVQKPSELIVLKGEPTFLEIAGTQLMWVNNTETDLFFDAAKRQFYFLTSGRWFRTADLKSRKWVAATTELPEDFKKIPLDHPRAHVLAAVPGTRQAEEAVVAASIPQTATIDRESAKAEVQYIGDPKFEPISGTAISYATNTPNDVFFVNSGYYLCLEGVWFVSTTPKGPWEAADKVPEEIYSIPPGSSKHNVTYVNIYESTPATVTYGYTAGYVGVYVGYGVAMWGTGYYYPPYYGYGYYPYPVYWPASYYTYGASAWYNPATGTYGRGSAVYGPYGGYARGAAYNPATGAYAWGRSAWGPYGAAASGGFYNPNTGRWGGSYEASNGYQSWGQSVVGRGDQWARTGSYSDSRGTVAGIKTSEGGKAIGVSGSQGQGFVGRSSSGDVYAGKDGNVYKRDQSSGQWYKNNGGTWESVNSPTPSRQGDRSGQAQSTRQNAGSFNRESVQSGLNRDSSARGSGNYNTQRTQAAQRTSGNSGFSSQSGGFSGRGGGRRR
jgi:hypothetical protein